MNFAGMIGIAAAVAVFYFTVSTTGNPKSFMDIHGAIIVIGGTLSVGFLSFRMGRIVNALKIVIRKMLGSNKSDFAKQIRIIVQVADQYRVDPKKAFESLPIGAHPFFRDGMVYLVEFGFSADEIDEIMTNALKGKRHRDEQEVKVWHTISRFPPAFGLLGATVGMIALLQTLGEPGAQDKIGPAMATALVATFYGLVCANLIFIPISENLAEVAEQDLVMRKIIKEGILLIQEKRHPLFIEEYLKSFLAPKQRLQGILSDDQQVEENAA